MDDEDVFRNDLKEYCEFPESTVFFRKGKMAINNSNILKKAVEDTPEVKIENVDVSSIVSPQNNCLPEMFNHLIP